VHILRVPTVADTLAACVAFAFFVAFASFVSVASVVALASFVAFASFNAFASFAAFVALRHQAHDHPLEERRPKACQTLLNAAHCHKDFCVGAAWPIRSTGRRERQKCHANVVSQLGDALVDLDVA
jgi:hypothetical protein